MSCFRALTFLLLALAVWVSTSPAAETAKPEDFVTVQKGTLPIIISAPHGGRKKVPDVPERIGRGVANFHIDRDENTVELTEKFIVELENTLKGKPWVVIARFDRKYLDVNRSAEQGYENEKAKPYYDVYHDPLAEACKAVKKKFGRGILLDIHGNGVHPNAICRGTRNLKTVTLLKERDGMAAIRGKDSILGRMEKLGYAVIPAAADSDKAKEDPRFAGEFIVNNYGGHTAYAIDAIQLEFGTNLRTKDKYATTAKDLAAAVAVFYETYLKE